MDRCLNLLNAACCAGQGVSLGVLGDDLDALNNHAVFLGENLQNLALLALICTGNNLNQVAGLDLSHELEHLRSQRNDLHELLVAKLTTHGAEDTGTTGITISVLQDHCGVLVELDVGAVGTTGFLLGADDDCLDNVTLLYGTAGDCILDGCDNDVANACVATRGTTENTDGQDFLRTSVVGDLQSRLLLNHISPVVSPVPTRFRREPALRNIFTGLVDAPGPNSMEGVSGNAWGKPMPEAFGPA
ncbi:coenzyme F420-reducing hydrogenase, beta subunit [Rothia mucilaginosa DY-18]|uniref:Coenzyme F420-reducing hydrogenase, beta subunit n=1 Tax=Rothia mucilaginosa (strain DY-18) TaxID=680646 RepID=D2NRP6_ROTMD|nr:coenzyme F420-reducing hydrogenase, beta subunit [Rothia mucilaginosa DY-18]